MDSPRTGICKPDPGRLIFLSGAVNHQKVRNAGPAGVVCGLVVRAATKYFVAMIREDIIRDIHGLDMELAALEEQSVYHPIRR